MFIHFQFLQGTTILYRTCYGGSFRALLFIHFQFLRGTTISYRREGESTDTLMRERVQLVLNSDGLGMRLGVYLPVAEEGV